LTANSKFVDGQVFDFLAKDLISIPEDNMKRFMQGVTATTRNALLVATAKAYGADFRTLVAFLDANGVPTRHRAPKQVKP
jgi:hypothetical protein